MPDHKTAIDDEGTLVRADQDDAIEAARALHHLATADPEPERDGILLGVQHEDRYNLERADAHADVTTDDTSASTSGQNTSATRPPSSRS